jgi:hypothetical protein
MSLAVLSISPPRNLVLLGSYGKSHVLYANHGLPSPLTLALSRYPLKFVSDMPRYPSHVEEPNVRPTSDLVEVL